jgi:hypothetical protein
LGVLALDDVVIARHRRRTGTAAVRRAGRYWMPALAKHDTGMGVTGLLTFVVSTPTRMHVDNGFSQEISTP